MTDSELQGVAAQAFNMAQLQIEQTHNFNFLAATYAPEGGLHRMKDTEDMIIQKLGEDWLNHGRTKDIGFGIFQLVTTLSPPPALVLGTIVNWFKPTDSFRRLPPDEQKRLMDSTHDIHHQCVRDGLFTMVDALAIWAQTAERVCMYSREILDPDAPPKVDFVPQAELEGRIKMYGHDTDQLLKKLAPYLQMDHIAKELRKRSQP